MATRNDLTPRLRQIATLIARGYSNPEIAAQLGLSVKTVDAQRYNLMARLGIHTTAGIVHHALMMGWLSLGDHKDKA